MSELLNPGIEPSFPLPETLSWPTDTFQTIKPYDVLTPLSIRPLRTVQFVYKALTLAQREYMISFFHSMLGPSGDFKWKTTQNIWAPRHAGPILDEVVDGGAPGSPRTYFVRFTWYDVASGQETLASPPASKLIQAGRIMQVKSHVFPGGVKAYRIYAHVTQGSECLQAHSNTRIWNEPLSGLVTATPLVPAVNNFKPELKFKLIGDLQWGMRSSNTWRLEFSAMEIEL